MPVYLVSHKNIYFPYSTHTHTQTCKHRQTGSSHCSSFVYTLTFSQHLSYVLYTFGKRGPFSNWGPYCSFCYKSPVWMPKQTHTHTLWGTWLSSLLWPIYRISLVGYHCYIVASTPHSMPVHIPHTGLSPMCGFVKYNYGSFSLQTRALWHLW